MQARFVNRSTIEVRFPYDPVITEKMKATGYAKWNPGLKAWTLKPKIECLAFLFNHNANFSPKDLVTLESILNEIEVDNKRKALKKKLSEAIAAPKRPDIQEFVTVSLHDYQWVPQAYSKTGKARFIIGDEPGLGKTLQAISITLDKKFQDYPVLIVAPANVVYNWQNELKDKFNLESHVIIKPLTKLIPNIKYYIISYDRLKNQPNLTNPKTKKSFFFILDESHLVCNYKTIRHKAVKRITKDADHIIMLTGTPVQNRPSELYPLLTILDPQFMSKKAFMSRYCGMSYKYYGKKRILDTSGAINLKELHDYLYENFMIRRRKSQVLKQLPAKTRQIVDMGTHPLEADSVLQLFPINGKAKSESPLFLDYVQNVLNENDKVLLFGHHKVMLDALTDLCIANKYKYIRIDGSVTAQRRTELVAQFQNDPTIKVAILSTLAAGVGITLTAASVVVISELAWRPSDLIQAEARADRFGQKSPVLVLYPLWSKFEKSLFKMLLEKMATIGQIVDHEVVENETQSRSLLARLAIEMGMPTGLEKKVKKDGEKLHV